MATDVAPMTCTEKQLESMGHDNVQVDDFSIITDTKTVWLSEQELGEDRKQNFEVDRETFNKLILWYTQGIVPKEDKRK